MFNKKPRWTHDDVTFLKNNWHNKTDMELSVMLGRTEKSVRRKREEEGLRKIGWRGYCAPQPMKESVTPDNA